jgi:hypothetical protein
MANIGKVTVRTGNRTTISSPNFEPRINVSFSDLNDTNTVTKQDGDVVMYDANSDEFVTKKLDQVSVNITNIVGGRF